MIHLPLLPLLKIQCLVFNKIPYRTKSIYFSLEFVSRLVNNQPSSTNGSNGQFLFSPSMPVHVPSPAATTPAELARLQQQIENNESMAQIKYI